MATQSTHNIGKKIFSGALWTVGMRFSDRGLGIISIIILARLLEVEDFGIVAKAVMIQGFLVMVTELGLEAALIKNQEATKGHYDTVWTVHIMRGGLIALILSVLAYPISIYLHEPSLEWIIYSYAAITFIGGFYNIGVVDFRKKMNFSYDYRYNLYKKLVGFITTITVAYTWETYWALVVGTLASQITMLMSSFLMSAFRPSIRLVEWRSLFDFSKWMLGYELLGAVSSKIDTFLLSRYSTTANVGFFTISKEISGAPSSELAMPVARAMMPGLAKLNHDIQKFSDMYMSSISLLLAIAIPAASGVSMLADSITLSLLGEKWENAIPFIEVLAFFGLTRAIVANAVSALVAYGRPDILTKVSTINAITKLIILISGMFLFGLMGLVWGVLIAGVIRSIMLLMVQDHIGILSIRQLLKNIWRIALATLTMLVGLYFFRLYGGLFQDPVIVVKLLSEIALGVMLYVVSLSSFWFLFSKNDGPERVMLETLFKWKLKEV